TSSMPMAYKRSSPMTDTVVERSGRHTGLNPRVRPAIFWAGESQGASADRLRRTRRAGVDRRAGRGLELVALKAPDARISTIPAVKPVTLPDAASERKGHHGMSVRR